MLMNLTNIAPGSPAQCSLCQMAGPFGSTGIAIAGGTIWTCETCAGYFLYPEATVEYVNSSWTQDHEKGWSTTVERAKQHVPHIRKRIEALLGRPVSTVLEVGCGTGYLGAGFKAHGMRYTGVDVDLEAINFARSKGIDAHCVRVEDLTRSHLQGSSYDLIIGCDVMEHVSNPVLGFQALRTLATGAIAICVPNPDGLAASLRANRAVNSLSQALLGNARNIVHSIDGYWHNIAYSKRSLAYFCQLAGIEIVELRDISVNDAAFGFVQPNHRFVYKLVDLASALMRRYPQLLLIGRAAG